MNKDIQKTITDIRNPFDTTTLATFLTSRQFDNRLVTLGIETPQWKAPLTIKQFVFGQSNPTYLIIDAAGNVSVLRRKPFPNDKLVSKSAHAIEREFFLLRGINKLNEQAVRKVPVPKTYLLCEDESVTGYVFYMMEFIDGSSIKNPQMEGLPPQKKQVLWNSIMDTISAIHSIDAQELIHHLPAKHFPQFSNSSPSKPASKTGYFSRQMRTLTAVSAKQSEVVDPIPNFDKIVQFILKTAPNDPVKKMLIHGDCKIDNFIFDKDLTKVVAVLDWELCTFGHPLFDLANFLQPFQIPNKLNRLFFSPQDTDIGKENPANALVIKEKLQLYYDKLGYKWDDNDLSNNPLQKWQVGFVFGLARLCVISQGIAMRIKRGSASSGNAAAFGSLYLYLSDIALDSIDAPKL